MLRQILGRRLNPQTLNLVRCLRSKKGDPGVRLRLQHFADDFLENDPETAESLEPDFMNVHLAHQQFVKKEKNFQGKVSRQIVGRKYFKAKQPNFLTWAEKEQIKLLNQQKPEEWTLERLSSSFPADPETISQIIRNQWHPSTESRILKHDLSVKENWLKLNEGEMQLEPILAHHLQSFIGRKSNLITEPKVNVEITKKFPKPAGSEFSSIITTCKKYKEMDPPDRQNEKFLKLDSGDLKFSANKPIDPEDNNMVLLVDNKFPGSGKRLQLKDLHEKYPHLTDQFEQPEKEPEVFEDPIQPHHEVENNSSEPDYGSIVKFQTSSRNPMTIQAPNENSLRNLEIRDRIKIPKSVRSKDKTYKVGDCFYDCNGEFLYRVPGFM